MRIFICLIFTALFFYSCGDKPVDVESTQIEIDPVNYLPFEKIKLENLSDFEQVSENWTIAASAFVDRTEDKTITSTEGVGVLVNKPEEGRMGNLFTKFEHGDIELEVDVMMPKNSNSGIYFQGRYEIQLFDSWGVEKPTYTDIGGIYEGDEHEGVKGFDGQAPNINAAKSPGLWQHFKIIFHAPKFDDLGNKIRNAQFEKVWLNGVLIHENAEVTTPTRASAFKNEQKTGPLMIQGDHGPVAFKNISYKLYDDKSVSLSNLKLIEYENKEQLMPNIDSLVPIREIVVDSISVQMVSGVRTQRILKFTGELQIPSNGEYLFDLKVNQGGAQFIVDSDTLINLNGNYYLDSLGLATVNLKTGLTPFTLIYNKHNPWVKGFSLEVEGPGLQKRALQAPKSLDLSKNKPTESINVDVLDETITQRSFLMHNGNKRTHCISVGTPEKINYAYDLNLGTLLKVWSGRFLDATPMWHSRGQEQLALPAGFTVSFDGDLAFYKLENNKAIWPMEGKVNRKQMGYELDRNRVPTFLSQIGNSVISDKMIPSNKQRAIKRIINIKGDEEIWHKIASGESIVALPDGTYLVNDESYFIAFDVGDSTKPIIRNSEGMDQLLIEIPAGEHLIEYNIIW
ncbi:DUF1080 domain-containing protein [Aurantibacter sp.]|uniref:3-keto-disaccharide hydrolase n=1 Tax=Aurantibacter sp. TaxID=2807103 RepID=UPI0032646B3A